MSELTKIEFLNNPKEYAYSFRLHYDFINWTCTPVLKINFKPNDNWLCKEFEIIINIKNLNGNFVDFERFLKEKKFKKIELIEPDYTSILKLLPSDREIDLKYNKEKTEKKIQKIFSNKTKSNKKFPLIPKIRDEIIEELLKLKIILEDIFKQKLRFRSTVFCGDYVDFKLPSIGFEGDLGLLSPKEFEYVDNKIIKIGNQCSCVSLSKKKICYYCYKKVCSNGLIRCFECKKNRYKSCGIKKCPKCLRSCCFNKGYEGKNPYHNSGLGPIHCECLKCKIKFCLKCYHEHYKEKS